MRIRKIAFLAILGAAAFLLTPERVFGVVYCVDMNGSFVPGSCSESTPSDTSKYCFEKSPSPCSDATVGCVIQAKSSIATCTNIKQVLEEGDKTTASTSTTGSAKVAAEQFALPQLGSLPDILGRVIRAVFGISGSLAFAFIIYGGFLWLTSGGAPETITKAQNIVVWASLGLILIFGAYALVATLISLFSEAAGVSLIGA